MKRIWISSFQPEPTIVADPEGVWVVPANPPPLPFETKIFCFHEEFLEKSGKMDKLSGKINKLNTHRKFEPPIQKSWIRPRTSTNIL